MIDDDLREHFAAESEEHLDTIEAVLAAGVADRAAIDSLFRAFHSLKGMSGALGGQGMMALAHLCEDILGLARQGRVAVAGEAADALIAAVDAMRRQRVALVEEARDVEAPRALIARLDKVADSTTGRVPTPAVAAAPAADILPAPAPATSHPLPAARQFVVLADVCAKVASALAPLVAGPSTAAANLASELAGLARTVGARRIGSALDALPGKAGASALPDLGDLSRALAALAMLAGQDSGASALQRAVAGLVGAAGLPERAGALADLLDRDDAGCVAFARETGRVAAAIGEAALEDLLLTVEDLWDRLAEPDAASAVAARRTLIVARLRAIAAGGLSAMGTAVEDGAATAAPPGLGIPAEFAALLGPEGAERAAAAVAGGRALYRARTGPLTTVEREATLIEWLTAQRAEVLSSRLVTDSEPSVLELLLAGPVDARAFEASRAALDPSGSLIAALVPLGATPEPEGAASSAAGTLRLRQETVDEIIALEAEVRAAGLSLADAAERHDTRALAARIASLARDLPASRSREATALAERVSVMLRESRATADRLTIALRRLSESMMELRVTPLAGLFARMPRIARAVAQSAGKEVDVDLLGGEVSIDRGLIELLADPLQHLVRNAVDHGAEPVATSLAAGKSARARLRIAAERRGADRVHIVVADDGGGIDTEVVRRAAVDRGIVTAAEAGRLDEAAVHRLLFRPGFSTRQEVSATSGRGVGLDAVREVVARLGGSIRLGTTANEYCRFRVGLGAPAMGSAR